ncbi:hypothetical protein Tco_0652881 [Tanacetum coccineum]|uniref:Uncharacterized protein n=1 Tax=Tanacetum coccineum TaxID=301880 RepID=A0ABQ4WYT8_9ASTR
MRAITSHILGAARVQIPENNLDDLHSSREEDGTSKTMDPQDLPGSFLLADIDLIILGLGVSLSRAVGFLRGTSAVVVILVKGHVFPTIVKVRPVGYDPLALVDGFTPAEDNIAEICSSALLHNTIAQVMREGPLTVSFGKKY